MNVCCVSHVFSASSQHGFLTWVHSRLRQVRPLCEVPGWGPCSVTLGSKVPQYPLGVSAGPTALGSPQTLSLSSHACAHADTGMHTTWSPGPRRVSVSCEDSQCPPVCSRLPVAARKLRTAPQLSPPFGQVEGSGPAWSSPLVTLKACVVLIGPGFFLPSHRFLIIREGVRRGHF